MSPSLSERLCLDGGVAVWPGWRALRVSGDDRVRFLHSQLTADVGGLDEGEGRLAALLSAGGRVQAVVLVVRRPDDVLLWLPEELVGSTRDALLEVVIADDVAVEETVTPPLRLVLGPAAEALLSEQPPKRVAAVSLLGARGFATWDERPLELPELAADEVAALQVVSGFPRWGGNVAAGDLVNETVLMVAAVSRDKGCYLGQETVAKLASGRGPARGPALLTVDGDPPADAFGLVGAAFTVDGQRAGLVTACVRWNGSIVLETRLPRALRVPGRTLCCAFGGGVEIAARFAEPPLVAVPERRDSADLLYHRAVALFADDRELEALRLLERALAVDPTHADAAESLGVILLRRGEYERAIAQMHRLLEVDPGSVMAHTNLSLLFNRLGRIEDAEREQQEAALAVMRAQQGERERAATAVREREEATAARQQRRAMFEAVLEIDPDDALASFGLGELLLEEGSYAAAVARLERALAADADHSAAYLALGRALEGLGDAARAREVYERGVEVAAGRGDLATAGSMQERLAAIPPAAHPAKSGE